MEELPVGTPRNCHSFNAFIGKSSCGSPNYKLYSFIDNYFWERKSNLAEKLDSGPTGASSGNANFYTENNLVTTCS